MAINFPNNPSVNDTFTVGGIQFTFTGVKWESGAVVEISSDTTPSLGGTLDAGTHNINNVGVITATTFSGNLIGNVTGTATTATYAQTAGIATNAQGLTGDPSIQVTNATVLGNLDVQGTTTTIDTAVTEVDSLQVDGNVGIGTTNATEILHVQTGTSDEVTSLKVKTQGRVELSRNHASAPYIKTLMSSGNPNIILGDSGGDKVLINGDGNSYFNGGNIGIGTEIPGDKLDVQNAGNCFVNIKSIDNSGRIALGAHTNENRIKSADSGNGAKELKIFTGTSSDTGITIDTSNNIGINSTAPSGKLDVGGTISDSMGPLRRLGINAQTGAYTVTTTDAGKLIRINNTGNITIPTGLNPGDMVSIVSHHNSTNTIVQDTGLTMYNTADGSTGNRTLAARGVCTILWSHTDTAYISGSGLT